MHLQNKCASATGSLCQYVEGAERRSAERVLSSSLLLHNHHPSLLSTSFAYIQHLQCSSNNFLHGTAVSLAPPSPPPAHLARILTIPGKCDKWVRNAVALLTSSGPHFEHVCFFASDHLATLCNSFALSLGTYTGPALDFLCLGDTCSGSLELSDASLEISSGPPCRLIAPQPHALLGVHCHLDVSLRRPATHHHWTLFVG